MKNTPILFVTQFLPSPLAKHQTGGTISTLHLLRALGGLAPVTVLSFDATSTPADFSNEPFQVVTRPSPSWRGLKLINKWTHFVRSETRRIQSEIGKISVIFTSTSTLAALDEKPPDAKGIAIIKAYENFGMFCPWVPWRQRIRLAKRSLVARLQDARHIRAADIVMTNSEFMRSTISLRFKVPKAKIHVLFEQSAVLPKKMLAPRNTVGFVHRGPEKNIGFVIELAARSPHLNYLVYGHQDGLTNDIPSNMTLRGWAADREEMFSSAEMWLVPSLWAEPFGRVSIEAQSVDRMVLVANSGGLPETTIDPRSIISGFKTEEWLQRIALLQKTPPHKIKENGAIIRQKFSPAHHDAQVASIISLMTPEAKEI